MHWLAYRCGSNLIFLNIPSTVMGSSVSLSVSHSSMVCKKVQTASAGKWVTSIWQPIKKMKITHSFSKQIPESRNSVIISPHFLCYGTPDNIVKIVRSGSLNVEFQILNSLINVFPEWIPLFVLNITCEIRK